MEKLKQILINIVKKIKKVEKEYILIAIVIIAVGIFMIINIGKVKEFENSDNKISEIGKDESKNEEVNKNEKENIEENDMKDESEKENIEENDMKDESEKENDKMIVVHVDRIC